MHLQTYGHLIRAAGAYETVEARNEALDNVRLFFKLHSTVRSFAALNIQMICISIIAPAHRSCWIKRRSHVSQLSE
jgi:hypothetical protein